MDMTVFEKITNAAKAKATSDTLVWCYSPDASVKKVKLQSLRKKYKNLSMKNNKRELYYISKVIVIKNEMKAYGETLSKQVINENVLRSLTTQFGYIVAGIE